MKAAVYYETGPPDVFRYEDVPDPAMITWPVPDGADLVACACVPVGC